MFVPRSRSRLRRRPLGRYRYVRLRWRVLFTLVDFAGGLVFAIGRRLRLLARRSLSLRERTGVRAGCGLSGIRSNKPAGNSNSPHPLPQTGEGTADPRVILLVQLDHMGDAVITSVNRDERKDGGAPVFAATIREIRRLAPGCTVEVLIPDFKGDRAALEIVMEARPEVLNHNTETVLRLQRDIRTSANYGRSLALLARAKEIDPEGAVKSGLIADNCSCA